MQDYSFYNFDRCIRNDFSHKLVRKPKAEAAEMFVEKWKCKGFAHDCFPAVE